MEYCIKEIQNPEVKSAICDAVLHSLPDWFGIENAIRDYILGVKDMKFWAAYESGRAVGFCALGIHYESSAEVHVMGILEEHHRNGIGRQFMHECENYCKECGCEFLSVKTVDELSPDVYYARTREFYLAMGFKKLELFKTLWDEHNPCLMLIKHIKL